MILKGSKDKERRASKPPRRTPPAPRAFWKTPFLDLLIDVLFRLKFVE